MRRFLLPLAAVICLISGVLAQAGEIRGIHGLCLDIKDGGGQGSSVIVWRCHGRQNQDWFYDGARRAIATRSGLCLDVRGGGGRGADVIVWKCHGGQNQQWLIRRDGTIRTPNNLCLDVRKGGKQGTGVTVWTCKSNGNANQKWR